MYKLRAYYSTASHKKAKSSANTQFSVILAEDSILLDENHTDLLLVSTIVCSYLATYIQAAKYFDCSFELWIR